MGVKANDMQFVVLPLPSIVTQPIAQEVVLQYLTDHPSSVVAFSFSALEQKVFGF